MSDTTTRLGLQTPPDGDFYNVEVQNTNMKKLDGEMVRLYISDTEPDDPGPLIWLQTEETSPGLLALGESAGEGLNLSVANKTMAVINADSDENGGATLSYTIR